MEETKDITPAMTPEKKWILAALALLLVLAGGWFFLFRVNRFSLQMELLGEEQLVMEYRMPYEEPGVRALLHGTCFWKEGVAPENIELWTEGNVDPDTLGQYTLRYHAKFLFWEARAERSVMVVDLRPPVILLVTDERSPWKTTATATDNYDGDITDRIERKEAPGLLTFTVADSSGNPAYVEMEIPLEDERPPEILLEGGEHWVMTVGEPYEEPGYTALDNAHGDVTELVETEGAVNWLVPGTYPITYTVTDCNGNTASQTRRVEVQAKPRPQIQWPKNRTVYLTFDDGPGPYTSALLDVLDAYGAKATFFVTGRGYEDMMWEIVRRGHAIGIHTVTHDYGQVYSSPEAYFADLLAMRDMIFQNTGIRTTLMRFPGGSSNTVSRHTCEGIMSLLTEAVQDAGFQYFDWNVDSDDAGGAKNSRTVRDNVIEGISKEQVSVVLQHDIHGFSVDAVEDILRWGKDNGYTFLPLKENAPGFHHDLNN